MAGGEPLREEELIKRNVKSVFGRFKQKGVLLMICLNKFVAVLGMTLVLVVAVFTFSCNAAETVVISFEQEEGFPAAGGDFTGKGIPTDVVTSWTNDSAVTRRN